MVFCVKYSPQRHREHREIITLCASATLWLFCFEIADGSLQISGVNGLVIEYAKRNGINGISLLSETVFPEALDIKACHAGIKKVSELLGIEIDMSRIESEAKKFDEGFKRYLKEIQEKKRKEEELGYIG